MTIETINNAGDVTVKLSGRLDSTTAGDLEAAMPAIFSEEPENLSFDISEVDFVSSKGIRVLVATYKKLNGKPLTLVGANASVTEVLRMSGLLNIFTVK